MALQNSLSTSDRIGLDATIGFKAYHTERENNETAIAWIHDDRLAGVRDRTRTGGERSTPKGRFAEGKIRSFERS